MNAALHLVTVVVTVVFAAAFGISAATLFGAARSWKETDAARSRCFVVLGVVFVLFSLLAAGAAVVNLQHLSRYADS